MPNPATLVQALGAAFCAILCALSGMGGGGMMIGARTAAWAKSGGGVPLGFTDGKFCTNVYTLSNANGCSATDLIPIPPGASIQSGYYDVDSNHYIQFLKENKTGLDWERQNTQSRTFTKS